MESAADLCAHGGVELRSQGTAVHRSDGDDLAVSTGALHLLRTLSSPHTAERPLVEHLIPHCGHAMYVDTATSEVQNMGCPHGSDWEVLHESEGVRLRMPAGPDLCVTDSDWCRAVTEFADRIEAFYDHSAPKLPQDDMDLQWYPLFWAEWHRRRSAAPCAI